ncbi:PAS domain S-box protein [Halobaculum sp. EA56]|uniref:PAS domain S-box protein n=1 Tax=Halobaculum sp. EA56 TaxID=3421648 RepID=UPI003EBA14B9
MSERGGISVLHVDDDPAFAELAAEFLERDDPRIAVETATDADGGLDLLADGDVDCVVSDYDMPGRDGIEFLEAVSEEYPDLPFVLFTGKGSEEVASEAISAGATDYLRKTSGTSQYTVLANRLTNAVEQYRTRLERRRRRERRNRQGDALLELTTDDAVTGGDFEAALERIAETAAAVLEVPRVNVWLFDDGRDTLRCVEHFDRSSGTHGSGMTLDAEEYPAYLDALESNRSIVAADAVEDPRTAELGDYLVEHDVGALLDATVRSGGEVLGVVCHEHVGGPREWTDDETEFASDVAELVHRAYRNRERVERRAELETTRARFRALTENTTHAVVTIDDDSTVRYANDAVEDVLGYGPEELVGGSLETILPERFREPHREAIARYLREGDKRLDWDWIELPGLHRDGHEVPLGISFGEATVDGEPRFTALVRDLTEREERER